MTTDAAVMDVLGELAGVRRVVIAGGGTGGHVNPALAIADAWSRLHPEVEIFFIGAEGGLEATLVPRRGYRIELVRGSRLVGGGLWVKLRGLWALLRGILQARRLLVEGQVELVIGVGGYASGAALIAARSLGLLSAVHESNAVPGLTNKVLGKLVDRVYLGFEDASVAFSAERVRVTGNPVRPEIEALKVQDPLPPEPGYPLSILVVGGSQGALFLNQNVPALLAEVAAGGVEFFVRHQVGKLEAEPVRDAYAALGLRAEVVAYIDDMAAAYQGADFAVTRAGSGTVSELAAAGLPALLVPFPFAAGDHQAANARAFVEAGGGLMCRQRDWNGQKLAQELISLLTDNRAIGVAAVSARKSSHSGAADAVVSDCWAMLEERW